MKTTPRRAAVTAVLCATLLVSCAGPPLTLYTLSPPVSQDTPALSRGARVIEITRASLPDELDNEDILLLDGMTLRRSSHGRWASRLSNQVTDLITQRLATRYPLALVTYHDQTATPSVRIAINITRLEVTSGGVARVEADWLMTPRNPTMPPLRDRRAFEATGLVATDHDVVALQAAILCKLADSIAIDPNPR